ncbi:MAG: putative glycoside hydrolase [Bacteroidota bacterium]
MKKIVLTSSIFAITLVAAFISFNHDTVWKYVNPETNLEASTVENVKEAENGYSYPEFYRGIYLNSYSGRNMEKLSRFISEAKKANFNTLVIDVHNTRNNSCVIPKKNVDFILSKGFHPVARVVVFTDGLRKYPVPKTYTDDKIAIARKAAAIGFKEIQFDYIRFNDHGHLKHIGLNERYELVEGFLRDARKALKKYNVKTAADVFGRIPLNKRDLIGQRMEGLDKVVDIICPMAYPSHYTWSKKLMSDPYHTVYITSKNARERVKHADIVTYIQAFNIKVSISGMSFSRYMTEQIRACHDAKIKGFIFWNASQSYELPFAATRQFYDDYAKKISQKETSTGKDENAI